MLSFLVIYLFSCYIENENHYKKIVEMPNVLVESVDVDFSLNKNFKRFKIYW